MNWLKKNLSTIILTLALIVGLCLMVYPTFSDWWNKMHQSRAIAVYTEQVAQIDNSNYEEVLAEAVAYNKILALAPQIWELDEKAIEVYNETLNIVGNGVMAFIDIPKIKVSLPIYHSTDDDILQVAVGHIAGTSLPVGGTDTHCVLSGHRGLPSAKLFTDLDKLVVGDTFTINVLDEVLTYEVDRILIVEPYDIDNVYIEPGKDLVTLVTCTPYGVNSHRLLVRGHRIETVYTKAAVRVSADAIQVDTNVVALVVAGPILFLLMMTVFISSGIKSRRMKRERKREKQ